MLCCFLPLARTLGHATGTALLKYQLLAQTSSSPTSVSLHYFIASSGFNSFPISEGGGIISANTAFGSFFLSQPFLPKADHRWPIVKVMVQASESFFCCWRGSAPADLLQRDSCHDPQARPAYRLFHPVSYQDCSIKQVQASRPRPSRPRLRTQT